jgi:hypothetical protein
MTKKETIEIILRHQRDLIDELLKRMENSEDNTTINDFREIFRYRLHPFSDDYLIDKLDKINERLNNRNFQCRYSEETEGIMKMLIAPKEGQSDMKDNRNTGLKEIRDFTCNSQELIIIDPYIFGGETENASNYIQEFKRCSRIDNQKLNKIHIIYSSKHGNTKIIKKEIKNLASDNNCTLTSYDSDKIHDRIWIKDKSEAIVVGTSFGGIGNRLCFILELPKYDLTNLLEHMTSEKFFTSTFS